MGGSSKMGKAPSLGNPPSGPFRAVRLIDQPIIHPDLDPALSHNINGPSLVAAPPWLKDPLARYYLYFADHKGDHIKLALADRLEGPWRLHPGGVLDLADSHFCTEEPTPPEPWPDWAVGDKDWLTPHIASPDIHVLDEEQTIRLYYHGLDSDGNQKTRVALSSDGINFEARETVLGSSYFRVFQRDGDSFYALVMHNVIMRSPDGLTPFEPGPTPLPPQTRHSALWRDGDKLWVFWSEYGDCPERIKQGLIDISGPWLDWHLVQSGELLAPERPWEGGELKLEPSKVGEINYPVRQLRDPCVFCDQGQLYLLYSCAGESGIGIARLEPR